MLFVGVDPGKTGAISIIDNQQQIVGIFDYAANPHDAWAWLTKTIDVEKRIYGAIENLNDYGLNQKTSEMLKSAGLLEGFLIASSVSFTRLSPSRWKNSTIPPDLRPKKPTVPQVLKNGGSAQAPAFEDEECDSYGDILKSHEKRLSDYRSKMKTAARLACQRIFPRSHELFSRKKDHDRAEATLMALYVYKSMIN